MDTPDILIHVHPDLSAEDRVTVVDAVLACPGIIAAAFNHHKHPHALIVVYNFDAISSQEILATVRKYDSLAAMVGL